MSRFQWTPSFQQVRIVCAVKPQYPVGYSRLYYGQLSSHEDNNRADSHGRSDSFRESEIVCYDIANGFKIAPPVGDTLPKKKETASRVLYVAWIV